MHSVRRLRKGFLLVSCALCLFMGTASADVRDQARRIHDRLAGVPPSQTVLDTMEQDINNGGQSQAAYESAAYTAMQNSEFYKVTLKNFAAPWTNRDFDIFVPLNDYVATVVGIVRDDDQPGYVPFNELLSADVLYVGAGNLGLPAYSPAKP